MLAAQLASFMEDLEASGLLRDGDGVPLADSAAAGGLAVAGLDPNPDPMPAAPSAAQGAAEDAEGAAVQAGDPAGSREEGGEGGSGADGVGHQGGDAGAAAGADGGAAEQRVLGELVGAPGWHEARAPCCPRPSTCTPRLPEQLNYAAARCLPRLLLQLTRALQAG